MTAVIDASSLVIVVAGVLSLPVTVAILGGYRRAVDRIMRRRSGRPPDGPAGEGSARASAPVETELPGLDRIARGVARNVLVVVAAGVVVGAAYATLFLAWNDVAFRPALWSVLAVAFAWPTVLGIWIVDEDQARWRWGAPAGYVPVLAIATAAAGGDPLDGLALWAAFNLLPTLVMLVLLTRRFRAVGILVLGVVLTGLAGIQVVTGSIAGGTGGAVPTVLVSTAAFLGASGAGWAGSVWLGRWYARRGFSDQMLLVGSMCYVFCIDYAIRVAVAQIGVLLWGLGVFALIAAGTVALHRLVHRPATPPVRLLVLRVFAPRSDAHRLLELVGARWRHLGPVRLIGGPDLALATVEPDEFLIFAAGGLERMFVDDPGSLDQRLELHPVDPDGRHRIEEFFCYDDTWRPTVVRLLEASDGVLMDLRGFDDDNRGVVEELGILARAGAMDRTVAIVDDSTDRPSLDAAMARLSTRPATLVESSDEAVDVTVAAVIGAIDRIRTR
jgi:hypothetical protein